MALKEASKEKEKSCIRYHAFWKINYYGCAFSLLSTSALFCWKHTHFYGTLRSAAASERL